MTPSPSFYSEDELARLGFRRCGRDVSISRHCHIDSPGTIEIGDHVRIDEFALLTGSITIGSHVHVAAYVALFGGGEITIEDYVGLAARTTVYSESDDFSGEFLAGPTIPEAYRAITSAPVRFERFALLGAGCVVFPGVTVHEGAAIGAMSLVSEDSPAWKILVGTPARPIRDRSRTLIQLTAEIEKS